MSDKAATIIALGLAAIAVALLLSNLHTTTPVSNGDHLGYAVVVNTITGDAKLCASGPSRGPACIKMKELPAITPVE